MQGERTAKPHCWQLCLAWGSPCSRYVDVGECRVGVVVIGLRGNIQSSATVDDSEHRGGVSAVKAGSLACEAQSALAGLSAHLQKEGGTGQK